MARFYRTINGAPSKWRQFRHVEEIRGHTGVGGGAVEVISLRNASDVWFIVISPKLNVCLCVCVRVRISKEVTKGLEIGFDRKRGQYVK